MLDQEMFTSSAKVSDIFFDAIMTPKRAVVSMPILHIGPTKKGIFWTPDMVQKVAMLARTQTPVPAFRYDIGGTEGSSHTPSKLSSPHFDVGWQYSGDRGAAFHDNAMWVNGEITNPEVIQKLQRATSEGQREINFASIGVRIPTNKIICSICGRKYTNEGPSCQHEVLQDYGVTSPITGSSVCYAIPTDVEKIYHYALTNDPADGEARIAQAMFQDMNKGGVVMSDDAMIKKPITDEPEKEVAIPTEKAQKPEENTSKPAYQQGEAVEGAPVAGPSTEELLQAIAAKLDQVLATVGKTAPAGEPVMQQAEETEEEKKKKEEEEEMTAQDNSVVGKYRKRLLHSVAEKAVRLGKYDEVGDAMKVFQDKSVSQLETIESIIEGIPSRADSRKRSVEVPEFGVPGERQSKIDSFADMSPDERVKKLGIVGAFEGCFDPKNQ